MTTKNWTTGNGHSMPAGKNGFFCMLKTGCDAHLLFFLMGTRVFFSWIKWPERETDHASLPTAEVTNQWSYNSIPPPPMCFHVAPRNNFIFLHFIKNCEAPRYKKSPILLSLPPSQLHILLSTMLLYTLLYPLSLVQDANFHIHIKLYPRIGHEGPEEQ